MGCRRTPPNSVEGVWKYAKYNDLPNYCPAHAEALRLAVEDSLCGLPGRQDLLRSLFQHVGLRP